MKPLKSGLILATWLMRISLVCILISMFYTDIKNFNLSSREFYIALGFVFFSLLCFIGGFTTKETLTVISGFVIFLLAGYKIGLLISNGSNASILTYLAPASIGFYFLTAGNQK